LGNCYIKVYEIQIGISFDFYLGKLRLNKGKYYDAIFLTFEGLLIQKLFHQLTFRLTEPMPLFQLPRVDTLKCLVFINRK